MANTLQALAKQKERAERERKAALARDERARAKAKKDAERQALRQQKDNRQKYLESRQQETDDINTETERRLEALANVLAHTLTVNDRIDFSSLRIKDKYNQPPRPEILTRPGSAPDRAAFFSPVKPLGLLEKAFKLTGRHERETAEAEKRYAAAQEKYQAAEDERRAKFAQWQAEQEQNRLAFEARVTQRNAEVDAMEKAYTAGEVAVVTAYNAMVLERSSYPEGFPQTFRVAYAPESKELAIEYQLPTVDVVPAVAEYKYAKTKDEIAEKPRKPAEIKQIYEDIVAALALRTIHEVIEADQGGHLQVITFNGMVDALDRATGHDLRVCLISVRTTRDQFQKINLARIDKKICLRNLGAQVSPRPEELQAVKPVVEFDMIDKRFVEQGDVLSSLDTRPNLMDLHPSAFETLVSNLFGKMGLETKLTRASRDGGVDVVAFDIRPVLGGKVVIQAKRYKNTVGVSAVRDLYGTMMNEGANKGIIVATSGYGPDAYEFAKDKPIEMIDGGGLLYLLDQAGIKAKIIMPQE